jgi:hypothetical protein
MAPNHASATRRGSGEALTGGEQARTLSSENTSPDRRPRYLRGKATEPTRWKIICLSVPFSFSLIQNMSVDYRGFNIFIMTIGNRFGFRTTPYSPDRPRPDLFHVGKEKAIRSWSAFELKPVNLFACKE